MASESLFGVMLRNRNQASESLLSISSSLPNPEPGLSLHKLALPNLNRLLAQCTETSIEALGLAEVPDEASCPNKHICAVSRKGAFLHTGLRPGQGTPGGIP